MKKYIMVISIFCASSLLLSFSVKDVIKQKRIKLDTNGTLNLSGMSITDLDGLQNELKGIDPEKVNTKDFKMEDDKAVAYADPVPEGAEDCSKEAADQCPVEAIKIEE